MKTTHETHADIEPFTYWLETSTRHLYTVENTTGNGVAWISATTPDGRLSYAVNQDTLRQASP